MKRSRFLEEQIAFTLKQVESDVAIAKMCRKIGVLNTPFITRRRNFWGSASTN